MIFYNFCVFPIFNFLKKSNIRGGEEIEDKEEATEVMGSFIPPTKLFFLLSSGLGQVREVARLFLQPDRLWTGPPDRHLLLQTARHHLVP